MILDWDVPRLECLVQRILRQDFQLVELERREHNLLHRTLILELGDDLSVSASAQTEQIGVIAEPDGNRFLLINGATGEHSQGRQIIRLADGEL